MSEMASSGPAVPPSPDEGIALCLRDGARMRVPAALHALTTYVLLEREDWFEDELQFVRRALDPGATVIDVGGSYGLYAVAAGLAVGATGRVWTYEPSPYSAHFLARSLADNGIAHATITQAAVSDHAGEGTLRIGDVMEGNSLEGPDDAGAQRLAVPLLTLDDEAARHGWRDVALLKIDVEGHGLAVLDGASGLLHRNNPLVLFEVKDATTRFDTACCERIRGYGYRTWRLMPGAGALVPFEPGDAPDEYLLNLFACKSDRAGQLVDRGLLLPRFDAPGRAPAGSGVAFLRTLPASRAFAAGWRNGPRWFAPEGDRAYFRALDAFAASRTAARPADRAACLHAAWIDAKAAVAAASSAERLLTYVRIALETGERAVAVARLRALIDVADEGVWPALREPFLPPIDRYDGMDATVDSDAWLSASVREAFLRSAWFSTAFADARAAAALDFIAGTPFHCAATERARQLMALVGGRQQAPQCHPLLDVDAPDNRNRSFWCGG
jgi:FkbM family methyltransferase